MMNHLCEAKRRVMQRSERHVELGFAAFRRFWERRQNPRHMPDWPKFEANSLYIVFVKFGRHILNMQVINPLGFVDFLLRAEVAIDHWCDSDKYQSYIREMIKNETPLEALERSLVLMESWGEKNQENWTDFFRKISPSLAVLWILSGRISPLILLTAPSAPALLNRLDSGQMAKINAVIDERFWEIKMSRHKEQIDYIVAELRANDL